MLFSLSLGLALATGVTGTGGASGLTDYPAFRQPGAQVEAIIDRGPIQELIIKCGDGTAIISFSKVEGRFCTPRLHCDPSLRKIVARTCGRN